MTRRRKNLWLTATLGLFFWMVWLFVVFFVEPETVKDVGIKDGYLPFFLSLFGALFFSLAAGLKNSRRAFLISSGVVGFLVLRLLEVGNWLNAGLILGAVVALELSRGKR